jgi:regulator of ribonuclease activity A
LNSYPKKSEKLGIGELNVPIHFAGVDFEPGHYIYVDENGMVVARKKLSLQTKEA